MALRFGEGGLACKLDENPFLGLPLGPRGLGGDQAALGVQPCLLPPALGEPALGEDTFPALPLPSTHASRPGVEGRAVS